MEKFVIVADARSGTHYIESIMNQHPDIQCFHEIFSSIKQPHFFHFLLEVIQEEETNVIPTRWPTIFEKYLAYIFSQYPNHIAVGMDIKYYQTSWVSNLFGILNRNQVKVIHLIRKNILKHQISWILHTMRKKLGREFHEAVKVPPVKLHVQLDTLIPELEKRHEKNTWWSRFLSKNFQCLEIYYEDCFDNPELLSQTITPSVLDKVYDFLSIEDRRYDLQTRFVKTNPGLLRDLVSNYEELVDLLSGTQWSYLLNDTIGENMRSGEALHQEGETFVN